MCSLETVALCNNMPYCALDIAREWHANSKFAYTDDLL